MISPLDPPSDATVLPMPGLEADNLLAFLALLGLLRALEMARPNWRPRVSWKGPPWVAQLHLADEVDRKDIVTAIVEALLVTKKTLALHAFVTARNKKGKLETKGRKSLFSSQAPARRLMRRAINAAQLSVNRKQAREHERRGISTMLRLDLLSSLSIENGNRGEVTDSPFKLPSGQQMFVGALYNSVARTLDPQSPEDQNAIVKALFAPWTRNNEADSLRLSPDEERRYALRFGDPTKSNDKPKTELGANALSSLGLSCLAMAQKQNGWRQVGFSGWRSKGEVTWPIFDTGHGVSLRTIVTTMALDAIVSTTPNSATLRKMGIAQLFRARRFVLDPNQGDYGNVSRARAI